MPSKINFNSAEVARKKKTLVTACQILYGEGLWEFWGEGHPSSRIEQTEYFLLPGHKHDLGMGMGDVTRPDDINVLDLEGDVVAGKYPPMDETFIHASIYKARPDVNGIAYTHPVYSKILASAGKDLRPVHHWAWIFGDRVRTHDSHGPIRSWEKAEEMVKALESRNSLMLWNSHSVITVGKSVEEAVVLNFIFENAAKVQYMAELLGEPKTVPTRSEQEVNSYVDSRVEILWSRMLRKYNLTSGTKSSPRRKR